MIVIKIVKSCCRNYSENELEVGNPSAKKGSHQIVIFYPFLEGGFQQEGVNCKVTFCTWSWLVKLICLIVCTSAHIDIAIPNHIYWVLYALLSPDSIGAGLGPYYFTSTTTRNWFAPVPVDGCTHVWNLHMVIACSYCVIS